MPVSIISTTNKVHQNLESPDSPVLQEKVSFEPKDSFEYIEDAKRASLEEIFQKRSKVSYLVSMKLDGYLETVNAYFAGPWIKATAKLDMLKERFDAVYEKSLEKGFALERYRPGKAQVDEMLTEYRQDAKDLVKYSKSVTSTSLSFGKSKTRVALKFVSDAEMKFNEWAAGKNERLQAATSELRSVNMGNIQHVEEVLLPANRQTLEARRDVGKSTYAQQSVHLGLGEVLVSLKEIKILLSQETL